MLLTSVSEETDVPIGIGSEQSQDVVIVWPNRGAFELKQKMKKIRKTFVRSLTEQKSVS